MSGLKIGVFTILEGHMKSFKMSAFIWSSGNQLPVLTLCTKKAIILIYPKSYCGIFDPRCLNFIGPERLAFFSYYSCPVCFAVRNETSELEYFGLC